MNCFAHPKDVHDVAEFEGAYLYGVIIGFIVTGAAMIFATCRLIKDEMDRHVDFAQKVIDAKSKL